MKTKKSTVGGIALVVIIAAVGFALVHQGGWRQIGEAPESGGVAQGGMVANPDKEASAAPDTGTMFIGSFPGKVTYDTDNDCYFLELRGARLPFKASPKQALEVKLEARGKNDLEKNRALLYGMIGPQVAHVTLLVNPDEEEDVMPAVEDLARYVKMAAPRKFAGLAYTKPGGRQTRSVVKGSQTQSLEKDASPETPVAQIKGPRSGATTTRVKVLGDGRFLIEGQTYQDVWKAADLVCVTLVKMLCGSPDCPDAAACATGGDCGCG